MRAHVHAAKHIYMRRQERQANWKLTVLPPGCLRVADYRVQVTTLASSVFGYCDMLKVIDVSGVTTCVPCAHVPA